ncbi:MAG TPA: hypothetical protein VFZ35_03360 [Sphingomicrobium sp.]
MRVQLVIALAASLIATSATAQNSVATAGNSAAAAPVQKAENAKKKATKPSGDKVCKRLSQGKVCMTAEQWKAYEEQF